MLELLTHARPTRGCKGGSEEWRVGRQPGEWEDGGQRVETNRRRPTVSLLSNPPANPTLVAVEHARLAIGRPLLVPKPAHGAEVLAERHAALRARVGHWLAVVTVLAHDF